MSLIPISLDGSKRPDGQLLPRVPDEDSGQYKATWKPFQDCLPTEEDLRKWFDRPDPPGIALVCGAVSGGLELIDFDHEAAELFPRWCELVEAERPGLIARLSVIRTPREPEGYHVWLRCPEITVPGNQKLAEDPARPAGKRTLIETRGEGGYALVPGCPLCCHSSGRPYKHHGGPPLEEMRPVTAAERGVLILCARSLNRKIVENAPHSAAAGNGHAGLLPGEDFDRRGPGWETILEPAGWTKVRSSGGTNYWRRPGKVGPVWSATTGFCHGQDGADLLRVFSSNAHPFENDKAYGKFRAYTLLHHGGDYAAAARALAEKGFGERGAALGLPGPGTAAGEPPPAPADLERLPAVLATGGAAALFNDRPLLEALARLAADDPAAFAVRRADLKKAKVCQKDLDAALKPLVRKQSRERPPVLPAATGYRIEGGCLCREHGTREGGTALVPLCNFTAQITAVRTRDDGAEQTSFFTVAGTLADGRELPPVQVSAADFAGLGWVPTAWHGEAVVYAGMGTRDHLRAAIELRSRDKVRQTVYAYTGWRKLGDRWVYLHGGGAIGAGGPVEGVEAPLPDALAGFDLPAPSTGEALAAAVRASLALLDGLAPDRLVFPLLGGVYRAALGEAPGPIDLSLFLVGAPFAGKSELAAFCQQHWGPSMDARHLPGNWLSTGNALEGLAFAAKDALLVIDDWAPQGSLTDVQRLRREADRVFRGQGNRAGRLRMQADGRLRPPRPPRGLIFATGEDVPPGQSLCGRLLALELSKDDLVLSRLTVHQQAGSDGLYAQALAGFVAWLAPQYADLCARLPGERARLRDRALARTAAGSARTPGIVADLVLGLSLFFDFALSVGVLDRAQRDGLARRGWRALLEAAARQAGHVEAAEPTGQFLDLLTSALASGRAHVADPDGGTPENPVAWGWRQVEYSTRDGSQRRWEPQGQCIG